MEVSAIARWESFCQQARTLAAAPVRGSPKRATAGLADVAAAELNGSANTDLAFRGSSSTDAAFSGSLSGSPPSGPLLSGSAAGAEVLAETLCSGLTEICGVVEQSGHENSADGEGGGLGSIDAPSQSPWAWAG